MIGLAWTFARRELRGGLKGFWIFILCLALGIGAIAAVGSVRMSLQNGLTSEGATILGGDAEMSFTYRFASDAEREFMARIAERISTTVDFRSMVMHTLPDGTTERGLTQVRGVDDLYPLFGEVVLEPALDLSMALADGGLVADQVLIDRMGLEIGDQVTLGTAQLELRAALVRFPDAAGSGFALGPRSLVSLDSLEGSGLLAPGTLFDSNYRLDLPVSTDLEALKAEALAAFRDTGLRWRDSRNGAPGVSRFVQQMGSFLVLVGLAGLAVGGIGISTAVRAYLESKISVIATLKTLGAETRLIGGIYLLQIGVLAALGISAGLMLGALLPLALEPFIASRLLIPLAIGIYPAPLLEAGFYGILTTLIFTLLPLARTAQIRASALYRETLDLGTKGLSRTAFLIIITLVAVLIAAATWFSGIPILALATAAGILGSLFLLTLSAQAIQWFARRNARVRWVRGLSALRLAFASIGAPGGGATSVVLSLGLGLTVLAAVGQVDANLRRAISQELPQAAPSYFFVDIQNNQLADFLGRVETDPGVTQVEHAPMLRGIITQINGQPARDIAGDHWVLRGDRGVTYSAEPPPNTTLTAGQWWAPDHTNSVEISFAAEEASEMGIGLGDILTVNILGRDIEGEITSLREVDFSSAGIGFILSMSPNALSGAPHTHIATVYAEESAEAGIVRDVTTVAPNITAIRVRDGIALVTEALSGLAAATSYGAGVTLLTGLIVLIGAAAAGERARIFEAAVLKTLGAGRFSILLSFMLRSAFVGVAAGVVAVAAAALAAWGIMTFVMESHYEFAALSAAMIIGGGGLLTVLTGLAFAWRPLSLRPLSTLRDKV